MIEDRHMVVAKAWGVSLPACCPWEQEMHEEVSTDSDAADEKAAIHETPVSHTVVKAAPLVDSPATTAEGAEQSVCDRVSLAAYGL
jgi:hypothetical protein